MSFDYNAPSPSTRRAWIEMSRRACGIIVWWSPSTRRAWIEIICSSFARIKSLVALHPEGVDRNR